MESQPQNPEFKNNTEIFHPCSYEHVKLNPYQAEPFSFENCVDPEQLASDQDPH